MKKLILTDVDGVLLNWEWAFDIWMGEHGYVLDRGKESKYRLEKRYNLDTPEVLKLVKIFNESAAIGFLPPLRDAVQFVRQLHYDHGYIFHGITSLSLDKNAHKLRHMNLWKLFGDGVFDGIHFLDTDSSKESVLELYMDTGYWWIEDKIVNAEAGLKLGLKPLIMEHGHNMDYIGPIPLVKDWAEIYNIITRTS